jgi:hypothetical protein
VKLVPEIDPPDSLIWSAEDIPPKCAPQCGASLLPMFFVVVYHGNFAENQPRINPWTNKPEVRHMLAVQELWYFMTQSGCWAAAVSGYPSSPAPMHSASVIIDPKVASSRDDQWKYMLGIMLEKGALVPRTVHALADFADSIPWSWDDLL